MEKMIQIGICDDQKEARHLLKKHIEEIREQQGASWGIRLFKNGTAFLEHADQISMIFLDIDMPGMDGLEVGSALQKINPSCKIIMATSHEERFKDVIRLGALRFVSKPYQRQEIEEALAAGLKEQPGTGYIEAYQNRVAHQIMQRNILYVRAFNGHVEMYTSTGTFRKDVNLNDMEQILDKRLFFRIHRSYIVNLACVGKVSNDSVYIGEEILPVGRRRVTDFKKALVLYETEYGG